MQPLEGISILITRAAHQSAGFIADIEGRGGIAYAIPTIEILPAASWDACDRALEGLHMYDGLIFTSANGVSFFFQRIAALGIATSSLSTKKTFVVGTKTRDELAAHGVAVTTMPERFTADDLAAAIDHEDLHGRTFLFPRGDLGSTTLQDTLRLLGASVDAVPVYRTVRPTGSEAERLRSLVLGGKVRIATFTSPSTFRNFIDLFDVRERESIRKTVVFAAIGPVTARAIRSDGFAVPIESVESTTGSLTSAIEAFVRLHEVHH